MIWSLRKFLYIWRFFFKIELALKLYSQKIVRYRTSTWINPVPIIGYFKIVEKVGKHLKSYYKVPILRFPCIPGMYWWFFDALTIYTSVLKILECTFCNLRSYLPSNIGLRPFFEERVGVKILPSSKNVTSRLNFYKR